MTANVEREVLSRRRFLGAIALSLAGCGGNAASQIDATKARAALAKRRGNYGEPSGKARVPKKGK